jgi:hypothetical protein
MTSVLAPASWSDCIIRAYTVERPGETRIASDRMP